MKKGEHVSYPKEGEGHVCVNGEMENGACLTGHEGGYKQRSCSYRWQAHNISKDDRKSLYNDRYKKISENTPEEYEEGIDSQAYKSKKGKMTPAGYTFRLNVPDHKHRDWHLDGPAATSKYRVGRKKVTAGKNFKDWRWPYWHNAHHLIPKSLFNNTIDDSGVGYLIKPALLSAKYNINHKINMIILPQDKEVARILSLPRHLVLKEEGRTPEYADHPMYTDKVRDKLDPIIADYVRAVNRANEGKQHPDVKPELSKKKLEKLSKSCYQTILNFGTQNRGGGSPLDDIPEITLVK